MRLMECGQPDDAASPGDWGSSAHGRIHVRGRPPELIAAGFTRGSLLFSEVVCAAAVA
jgi:hypothetical protein